MQLNTQGFLASDADGQLILSIPFTCSVNIRSICVIGRSAESSPSHVKLFVNRTDIDFDNADSVVPTQEIELTQNMQGLVEHPTRYTKFQGVSEVVLYFSSNFGSETTEILYVGLKGSATKHKREPVVATYELRPMPKATDTPASSGMGYIS